MKIWAKRCLFILVMLAATSGHTRAEEPEESGPTGTMRWMSMRPDGHGPIGVMGDNTHMAGGAMVSVRYMRMDMKGNRDGTSSVSTDKILQDFMVAPTEMTMEMIMLGSMYAPSDDLVLMAMVPYTKKSMDHVTRMDQKFTTESEGIGDVSITALYVLRRFQRQRLHLNAGLSLPTGSIEEKDDTPMGNVKLAYPMQLGSGTFDLLPGLTYLGQTDEWSWGGRLMATIRLGENSENYALGNRYALTGWGARKWSDWLSFSARLDSEIWENVRGADPDLDQNVVQTSDPNRRGGKRLIIYLGANWFAREGALKGHRLAIELGTPAYESLDGPQLETDRVLIFGWKKAF